MENELSDSAVIVIICIMFGTLFLLLALALEYRDLRRFKICYENDFNIYYCEKYKNY